MMIQFIPRLANAGILGGNIRTGLLCVCCCFRFYSEVPGTCVGHVSWDQTDVLCDRGDSHSIYVTLQINLTYVSIR